MSWLDKLLPRESSTDKPSPGSAGRSLGEVSILRGGAVPHRSGIECACLPEMRPSYAHPRAGPAGCLARCRRTLRCRSYGLAIRFVEIQGQQKVSGSSQGGRKGDRRDGCPDCRGRFDQVFACCRRLFRVRVHGRFHGVGCRRAVCPGREGSDRETCSVCLYYCQRRRPYAGRAAFPDANGENQYDPDPSGNGKACLISRF